MQSSLYSDNLKQKLTAMNTKRLLGISVFFSLICFSATAQSVEQGFSVSGTTAYVAGDFDYAGFYGFTLGADLHLTLTESEKVDFALSAGILQLLGLDGIEGEGFTRVYGNILFNNLFTENQHFGLGVGYGRSLSDRIDVSGLYLEAFYHFSLSENFTLAPGGFVILGIPELDDTVSSSVVVLGLRGTLKL